MTIDGLGTMPFKIKTLRLFRENMFLSARINQKKRDCRYLNS